MTIISILSIVLLFNIYIMVQANELKTSFSGLDIKDSDKYSLDWKWEYESGDDNKDTYIGENMDDVYKLNIRFYIEQVD